MCIRDSVSRIKKFFLAFLDLLTIRLLFLPSMFTPPKYRTYFLFVLIIYEHTFFVNYFLYFNEHRFDFVPFLCYNMVTSIFLPIGQYTRKWMHERFIRKTTADFRIYESRSTGKRLSAFRPWDLWSRWAQVHQMCIRDSPYAMDLRMDTWGLLK